MNVFGRYFALYMITLGVLCLSPVSGSLAQVAYDTPVSKNSIAPITVQARLEVEQLPNEGAADEFRLASIGVSEHSPTTLALTWGLKQVGWFPTWVLQLESDVGLLPLNSPYIKLVTLSPKAGHTYQASLSYDPLSGDACAWVWDSTIKGVVFEGHLVLKPFANRLESQGSLPENQRNAKWEQVSETAQYTPRGATWNFVGAYRGSEVLVPTTKVNREIVTKAGIRVEDIGPAQGDFRVKLVQEASGKDLGTMSGTSGQSLLPIAVSSLPLGISNIQLEYTEHGEVIFAETEELQVGQVDLAWEEVLVHYEQGKVTTNLTVDPDGAMTDLRLHVQAEVARKVWDPQSRSYRSELAFRLPVLDTRLDLIGDPVQLPITIQNERLREPGLWEVSFSVISQPSVFEDLQEGATQLFTTYRPARLSPGGEFTIAVLPDTQYYTLRSGRGGYPDMFMRQTQCIAERAVEQNIVLALHLGDLTERNEYDQWQVAKRSMNILDGVVPYVLATGNHDMNGIANTRDSMFNTIFPLERYQHLPSFGGTFEQGRFENSFHRFELGGSKYLVLALEFYPRDEVIAWANQVVSLFSDHQVILITHTYTSTNGNPSGTLKYGISSDPDESVNSGYDLWQKLVRKHSNMLLVVSGHHDHDAVPRRVGVGDNGNRVFEVLMDFQFSPHGGDGWLGLLRFKPAEERIGVEVYSPVLDMPKNDSTDGFYVPFTIDLANGTFVRSAD